MQAATASSKAGGLGSASRGDRAPHWLESLEDGCFSLSPVWFQTAEPQAMAFQDLVFRPSAITTGGDLGIPAAVVNDGPVAQRMDAYLLRQVLRWLQDAGPEVTGAIPLHAATWCSDDHFQNVLRCLQSAPVSIRRRLIISVKEASISRKLELYQLRSQELRSLGVRLCIDDFGDGIVSLQALFSLQPAALRLHADLGRRIDDPNNDHMVEFLVAYCRYKRCLLIISGIDRPLARRHWLRYGVDAMQGAASRPDVRAGSQ